MAKSESVLPASEWIGIAPAAQILRKSHEVVRRMVLKAEIEGRIDTNGRYAVSVSSILRYLKTHAIQPDPKDPLAVMTKVHSAGGRRIRP